MFERKQKVSFLSPGHSSSHCRIEEVKSRNIDALTPNELAALLVPKAEELVPGSVRQELLEEIKRFLDTHVKMA